MQTKTLREDVNILGHSLRESPAEKFMSAQDERYKAVAKRIKEARSAAGLSQTQLAERLGVTQATVGQWERRGQIAGKNLSKAAAAMGVSADWILLGDVAQSAIIPNANLGLNPSVAEGYIRNLIPSYRVLWDGTKGTLRDLEEPHLMLVRPAGVARANAYALTVVSAQKSEGFRAGSTIYLDPDGEPRPGEWALIRCGADVWAVEIKDYTKDLVRFVHIFSRQEGELPRSEIEQIHALHSIAH